MQRRRFLSHTLRAGAALSAPGLLAGCDALMPSATPPPDNSSAHLAAFGLDSADIAQVASTLGAAGADFGEVFFQRRVPRLMTLRDGDVRTVREEVLHGAGLRVVRADAVGFAVTEDLTVDGLLSTARVAAAGATPAARAPLNDQPRGALYRDVTWGDVRSAEIVAHLERVEAESKAADPNVTDVRVSWRGVDDHVLIVTLDGRVVLDERPLTRASLEITMTRGDVSHTGFASMAARAGIDWYDDERIAEWVATAVARTESLFAARRPPSGNMPVMFAAGAGGVLLHEAIGHAFEADFVLGGSSPYADALQATIANAAVTIVDDATLPMQRGSLNYDDEGTAGQRTVLVENGVLQSYLHDRSTAERFGVQSTASARRESYRHKPLPRMTCTTIENGKMDAEELVEAMGRGIIVETIVGGNVSLPDGRYRFDVRNGWLVEKGKRLVPLRDFAIFGTGTETLANISLVADDFSMDPAGWSCGKHGQTVPVAQGAPSFLVSSMQVGT